jgi:hypothetical protein
MTTKRSAAVATTFSRVCAPPPPLDQPPRGRHLVGSVEGKIEAIEAGEGADVQPELARRLLDLRRGGHVNDPVHHTSSEDGQQPSTVEPVPRPTRIPSLTSAAPASAAACFSRSIEPAINGR